MELNVVDSQPQHNPVRVVPECRQNRYIRSCVRFDCHVLQPYIQSETEFRQLIVVTANPGNFNHHPEVVAYVLDGKDIAEEFGTLSPIPETHPLVKLARYAWSHGILEKPDSDEYDREELADMVKDTLLVSERKTLHADGQDGGFVWTKTIETLGFKSIVLDYAIVTESFMDLLSLYKPCVYSRLQNFPSRMEKMELADSDPLFPIQDVLEPHAQETAVVNPRLPIPLSLFYSGIPV